MELLEAYPEVLAQVEVMWVDGGYDGDKFALSV
jgi:putative transposase